MGPFIIYEYCEHGPLRDFLADRKNNLTLDLEENLFRFGLDIAKGMEYLAGKGVINTFDKVYVLQPTAHYLYANFLLLMNFFR